MSGALIDFGPDTSNGGPAAPSPDDDAERIARERVEGSVHHSPHAAQGQHAHKTGSTSTNLLGPLAEEDPLWMETDGLPGMGDTSDGSAGSGSDSGAVSALRALQEGPSGHTMDARRSSHASLLSSAASCVPSPPRPAPSPLPLAHPPAPAPSDQHRLHALCPTIKMWHHFTHVHTLLVAM
jgi:hypothetical protein